MTSQPPIHLPNYTVLGLAGAGAMGSVYKAEQTTPRRLVALKVLGERRTDPAGLAAFRHEAALIAQLEHPHIVPVYDFGEQDGLPYLVLRYLDSGTLADRLAQGPIDLPTAVRWLRSVAEALDFAHKQGVIHKDIKPSNILLDQAGNAYLSDFGIAGTVSDARTGAPTGSAAYMSPEQGRGEQVDARADVYALGVVLYEVLTGQKPFAAETALGVIVRHIHDPVPSARTVNPAIPPAADELIEWAMAKDPADRPQTAGEFGQLLGEVLSHPDRPLPGAKPHRTLDQTLVSTPLKRRRIPALALGAGGLGVVCLTAAALFGGSRLAAALFPGPTSLPSTVERPPATNAPLPSALPAGQILADDFSDPGSGFAVPKDPDGAAEYIDGVFRISVLHQGIEWFSPSRRVMAQDVVVDVDVIQESPAASSELAVLCRWVDSGNYVVGAISDDRTYSIWQKRDGVSARLVEWTPTSSLSSGVDATHNLRLTCSGDHLQFEVDGALLGEATDPSPAVGDIALMAGLRGPGELIVSYDNLRVTTPTR